MTGEEAKTALRSGEPVVLNDIEYERIVAIIYRPYLGGITVSAELKSKTGNSSAIAPIQYIQRTDKHRETPDVVLAPLPIDSISLHTYAGEFRVEFAARDGGCAPAESGVGALPSCDTPYSEDDSIIETWKHAINRVRDVAATIIGDWYEARELNRFTGVPMATETKK